MHVLIAAHVLFKNKDHVQSGICYGKTLQKKKSKKEM